MMLFRWIPVPGTTTPELLPFVQVTEHARPSPSRTETCVVEPRFAARKRSRKPGSPRPAVNSVVRSAWTSSITPTSSAARRLARRGGVEPREREREQDAAGGRRRVREDAPPAVGGVHRLARDRRVGGEVARAELTAPAAHVRGDGRGEVAGVERRAAVTAEPLDRLRQLVARERLALAQRAARGRELAPGLRRRHEDPGEQLEDVGLLGVQRNARARERRGRRSEVREREAPPPRRRFGEARRDCREPRTTRARS